MSYTEADEFIQNPQAVVARLIDQNLQMIVSKIKALEQGFVQQQKQIGELSAKVWRLEAR